MKNIIVHIPHASIEVPKLFKERLLIDEDEFKKENIFEADYLIDTFKPKDFIVLSSNYSRMFCDVERFKENEEMEKYSMGLQYQKDTNGKRFIRIDKVLKEYCYKYYDNHHYLLNKLSTDCLKKYGSCIILDLHSFSDEYVYKLFGKSNCPDICIGVNQEYDNNLLTFVDDLFKRNGYSTNINYPYSGTMIPSKYLNKKNTGIKSIMIEVNKRVYLKDDLKAIDTNKTNKLSKCFDELYRYLLNNYC